MRAGVIAMVVERVGSTGCSSTATRRAGAGRRRRRAGERDRELARPRRTCASAFGAARAAARRASPVARRAELRRVLRFGLPERLQLVPRVRRVRAVPQRRGRRARHDRRSRALNVIIQINSIVVHAGVRPRRPPARSWPARRSAPARTDGCRGHRPAHPRRHRRPGWAWSGSSTSRSPSGDGPVRQDDGAPASARARCVVVGAPMLAISAAWQLFDASAMRRCPRPCAPPATPRGRWAPASCWPGRSSCRSSLVVGLRARRRHRRDHAVHRRLPRGAGRRACALALPLRALARRST